MAGWCCFLSLASCSHGWRSDRGLLRPCRAPAHAETSPIPDPHDVPLPLLPLTPLERAACDEAAAILMMDQLLALPE